MLKRTALSLAFPAAFAALGIAAAVAAGPAAFGRIALAAGLPGMAAALSDDPVTRGVALFRAGDYAGADAAFTKAGRSATYNRGDSLAATGRYALAVAYFDAVLFADPSDADARFNRELVARLVDPVVGESNQIDGIAANVAAEQSDAASTKRDVPKATTALEQVSVMDPRVSLGTAASTEWLATMTDDPGLYLRKRLKAEHQRRQDLGLANPVEDTAW